MEEGEGGFRSRDTGLLWVSVSYLAIPAIICNMVSTRKLFFLLHPDLQMNFERTHLQRE